MNKNELIAAIAERTGMSKKDAEAAVNAIFDTLAENLAAGKKINITGFGSFEVKTRAARTGFNPRTQEPVEIPATNVPAFKPAKALKERV